MVVTIRVAVVDDHELVREGLRRVLENEPDLEVVWEAATATEALQLLEASRPDVVVVDLMAPPSDGLLVCRAVSRLPDVASLLLTAHRTDDVLSAAVRAEVSGFLDKKAPARDVVRSLRVVATGGTLLDAGVTAHMLERVRSGRAVGHSALLADLSNQERRLLDHLGEGLSNRQIAARMELAEKTVKNYVSNLLRKLDMRSRTEAAVFVTNLKARPEHATRG